MTFFDNQCYYIPNVRETQVARIACCLVKIRTFPQLEQPVSNPTTGYRQDSWYFNYVSSEFTNLYNLYINCSNQLELKILNTVSVLTNYLHYEERIYSCTTFGYSIKYNDKKCSEP